MDVNGYCFRVKQAVYIEYGINDAEKFPINDKAISIQSLQQAFAPHLSWSSMNDRPQRSFLPVSLLALPVR